MRIMECDICGTELPKDTEAYTVYIYFEEHRSKVDVCPECMSKFRELVREIADGEK